MPPKNVCVFVPQYCTLYIFFKWYGGYGSQVHLLKHNVYFNTSLKVYGPSLWEPWSVFRPEPSRNGLGTDA